MTIKSRLDKLETLFKPKLARPILCIGSAGATPEQQAQIDEAEALGRPLKVIRMIRAEAKLSNNQILN
ncbi:MAG: hypothetical protein ACXW1Z_20710 [Methylobacter sp.]